MLVPASSAKERQDIAITEILRKDPSLSEILQKAVVTVAKGAQFKDEKQTEKLRFFFVSPEAEAIVRQLYSTKLSETRDKPLASIRQEFCLSLSFFLGVEPAVVQTTSDLLFEAIAQACDRALSAAIEIGALTAHEGKSSIRHRIVLDEIANIKKNIEYLGQATKPDLGKIFQFERDYRSQLADRHGFITPPHFDVARRIPIKEIFVAPRLLSLPRRRGEESEPTGQS